ncbi:DUF1841 family protein [Pelomonas sp. SE-A7]|uniref:DUF1841 family protein n=1 Tax=Pelomonas sp. SE-A7 TaxID=3054953 RepID=UPI00259CEA54|nr:DUF1841 family protein [Pelomonas sp. SE-A7]MDM4764546.1 DUF1841 family protein [Pelomonas sp. SE-A7]
MFAPSQIEVRKFFCATYRKLRDKQPLIPMEALAAGWIDEHPEYHELLGDEERALAEVYTVEEGKTNPFLHLSMHLTITEQVSIDQPTGIRQAVELLAARRNSLHEAQHAAMDCLGEMIWASQRSGMPPDGHQYLDCVRRKATS